MQRIRIKSRHPSHQVLRMNLPRLPFSSVVRFGSVTESDALIEINSIESIKRSANKRLMKECFSSAGVNTAEWASESNLNDLLVAADNISYPIVLKNIYGSRGTGNYKINSRDELISVTNGKNLENYIIEKYHNYSLEYRIHYSLLGYFYTCRKALKTGHENEWQRHDDNCVWFLETNEKFMKPNSWEDILDHCNEALIAIGADVLSFDIKVQSPYKRNGEKREYQKFFIIECNSASSMGSHTEEMSICASNYITHLPELIKFKKQILGK